nr:outer membrane beta-barrel protein [Cytophagales bacterium]
MKEQFDRKLVERIKASFRKDEAPFDPKQWEKLASVYFKPKRPIWYLYWPMVATGIAASLFLVLVLDPFGFREVSPERTLTENQELSEQEATVEIIQPVDSLMAISTVPQAGQDRRESRTTQARSQQQPAGNDFAEESPDNSINSISETTQPELPVDEKVQLNDLLEAIVDNTIETVAPLISGQDSLSMDPVQARATINQWLSEAESSVPSSPRKESSSPFKLGVMVSPQASSNTTGGMNLGAGVMSEISLSKRLKLDVGVNYARMSMEPNRTQGMATEMSSYASPVQNMDMLAIRTSSNFIGSELRLNFASLDIPVNLKYRVLERKNADIFLITGLSSMVYLDQQATETFETNSFFTNSADGLSFAPSVQRFTSVYTPDGAGNSLDVGGMLNLSVGYEYNLSDGMFLSLEPFYKLPLGNLTFANQQFSIGGLNMRMNFKLGK